MSEWLKLILTALPGVVTALVAAYLAAKFSIRRLYEEKWWDRKAQAYTEIIDALSLLIQCCDRYSDHPGPIDLPKHLDEGYAAACAKLEHATTIGAFVISEDAAKVLTELESRSKPDYGTDESDVAAYQELNHYAAALTRVRDCARKDLHR